MKMPRISFMYFLILSVNFTLGAQTPLVYQQGTLYTGSYHGGDVDTVNLENGAMSLRIPLFSLPQKGKLALSYSVVYNSNNLTKAVSCHYDGSGNPTECITYPSIATSLGPLVVMDQNLNYELINPDLQFQETWCGSVLCPVWGDNTWTLNLHESDNATHLMMPTPGTHNTQYAADGSGYVMHMSVDRYLDGNCSAGYISAGSDASATTPGGITYDWSYPNGCYPYTYTYPAHIRDRFGNQISASRDDYSNQYPGAVQDSVGRTVAAFPVTTLNTTSGCPNLGMADQPLSSARAWTVPGANGGTATYLFCYAIVPINDAQYLGCFSDTGYCPSGPAGRFTLLQSVVLPNGTYWGFVYESSGVWNSGWDSDPTNWPIARGSLTKLIYPTGGSISYGYTGGTSCNDTSPAQDLRRVVSRQLSGTTQPWIYSYLEPVFLSSAPSTTTVKDPDGNETVHTYQSYGNSSCVTKLETNVQRFQGLASANNPLETETNQYANVTTYSATIGANMQPSSSTKQLTGGTQVTTTFTYPTLATGTRITCPTWTDGSFFNGQCGDGPNLSLQFGNANTVVASDPTGGTVNKTTHYEWEYSTAANAYAANDLELVHSFCLSSTSSTCDPSWGTAYSEYGYNGSGSQTSEGHRVLPGGSLITTSRTFTGSGRIHTVTDPKGYVTTIDYDGNELFPVKITKPNTGVNHFSYYSYDSNTGNMLASVDENGSSIGDTAHRTDYSYDSAGRITSIQGPPISAGRPRTDFCYTDQGGAFCSAAAAPYSIYKKMVSSPTADQVSHVTLDGFGRTAKTMSAANAAVDSTYDNLGRLQSITNPYTDSPDATTMFTYDPLSRKKDQTQPDGNHLLWSYSGDQVDATDEAGRVTRTINDGFGRLTDVYEDPSGVNLHTHYDYDSLNNLKTVTQYGASGETQRVRNFSYDSLSRLIAASNPENSSVQTPPGLNCPGATGTWTTCYIYDPNGNLKSKTNNRNVTTDYAYDALNRLISKGYSGTDTAAAVTPSSCYQYDVSASGTSNAIGRLVGEWTQSGTCPGSAPSSGYQTMKRILSYDAMGRIKSEQQCHLHNCTTGAPYSTSTNYDLAGNPTFYTNGIQAIALSNSYDSAGRLKSVSNSLFDPSHPATLFSGGLYTPAGGLQSFTLGTQINVVRGYDNRLRVTGETANHP